VLERTNVERANVERANVERANVERVHLEQDHLEQDHLEQDHLEQVVLLEEWQALQWVSPHGQNLDSLPFRLHSLQHDHPQMSAALNGFTSRRSSSLMPLTEGCTQQRVRPLLWRFL
jgi:hypothetical protein